MASGFEILGCVDGFAGSYLTGWAIAQPDVQNCFIEIIDSSTGSVVATGRAARSRDDLRALGYGRSNFAFSIPIANCADAGRFRVTADGIELLGSPVLTGKQLFDGSLTVTNGWIDGWVHERCRTFQAPRITLFDQDGVLLAEIASNFDNSGGDPLFRPARFGLPLPAVCFGREELCLFARTGNIEFASTTTSARLIGYLDLVSATRCAGWLLSPDVPRRQFEIEVMGDGEVVAQGRCCISRPDLRELYPESTNAGFDINIPEPKRKAFGCSEMSIRLGGTAIELFDGPFVVASRSAMISTVHAVGRRVRSADLGITAAERLILQAALRDFAAKSRANADENLRMPGARRTREAVGSRRLNIIVPVYRGVDITRQCIESVLRTRDFQTDALILINDCSPDSDMARMLHSYVSLPNVFLLINEENRGFIQSVNRGLAFCRTADVILLNSDAQMFNGGLEELWRIAHSAPNIGTVTALSNNATIFSYPHPTLATASLADVTWSELAEAAYQGNSGVALDVPTAHGFCMLITRELLDRFGRLNEIFGRGYGEENELCLRAAELGYRHVAAAGVFVEHKESVSFGSDKEKLVRQNLAKLNSMFPEYPFMIAAYEEQDELRKARWTLDAHRLRKATNAGKSYVLVVENWLDGGTRKAASDIESALGCDPLRKLSLTALESGGIELTALDPVLKVVFSSTDTNELFRFLNSAKIELILIHQILGFNKDFITDFGSYAKNQRSVFFIHDFYPLCPRVNFVNALDQFCELPPPETCVRCMALGGSHEASRIGELTINDHRDLFARVLGNVQQLVAPSKDTATRFALVFPKLVTKVIPHPRTGAVFKRAARTGSLENVTVLGAIGPHKGSSTLLEIARRAQLSHPRLRFNVVGYTNLDEQLNKLGNVSISGRYSITELPDLVAASNSGLALFLHGWPETFSYTLTEAVELGLIPLVPDIGAPAERVRAAGFGVVFPFPIDAVEVLELIENIGAGNIRPYSKRVDPQMFSAPQSARELQNIFRSDPKRAPPSRAPREKRVRA